MKERCYEQIKLPVRDLRPGMFVCELDRPWIETPFLLAGFPIETKEDIHAVTQYCDYVYIDITKTRIDQHITVYEAPVNGVFFSNEKSGSHHVKRTTESVSALQSTVSDGVSSSATFNANTAPQGLASFAGKKSDIKAQSLDEAIATRDQASKLVKTYVDEIHFGKSPDVQLAGSTVSECVARLKENQDAMMFVAQMRDKDASINHHSFNVCIYSIALAKMMGYDDTQFEQIGLCALLHDVGKINTPGDILKKPGKLTDHEKAIIREHTTSGRDILMSVRNIFSGAVDVAYGHHENLDGTGYPRGLSGQQLNIECKIVSVVDKYDAMTSRRPYRDAMDHLSAVGILNGLGAKGKIDGTIVKRFISYLGFYPPGSIVKLSSGETAIVLESKKQRWIPKILVVLSAEGHPVQRYVDMSDKEAVDGKGKPYRIVSVRPQGDSGINLTDYHDIILSALDRKATYSLSCSTVKVHQDKPSAPPTRCL